MKTYFVCSYGYECPPEFPTLEAARAYLSNLVSASVMKAKRVSKQSRKHKLSPDCYKITLGADSRSTLYAHHSITVA